MEDTDILKQDVQEWIKIVVETKEGAAHITWTGMAAYGSGGPSSVEDMFVTGQADFTRSPLPIRADEYFVRQTR